MNNKTPEMGFGKSLIYFGLPTVILYLVTFSGVEFLYTNTGWEHYYCWFLSGGSVFILMFFLAILLARKEIKYQNEMSLLDRLNIKKLSGKDKKLLLLAFLITIVSFSLIMGIWFILNRFFSAVPLPLMEPPFLEGIKLPENRILLLTIWVPFFFFNIVGEEIYWRGYILPRQVQVFRDKAWIVQGLLWMGFHYCFGLHIIISVAPLLFILPYFVQKSGNTTVGIILHGVINGSGFISITTGLIHS